MKSAPVLTLPDPERIDHILALDLSLNHTGRCESHASDRKLSYGVLEPDTTAELPRLIWIRQRIMARVTLRTLIVLEGFAFARPQYAHQLGGLGYAVRLALYEAGAPFLIIPPATAKKFVSGKGNCKKDVVLKAVYQRFGIDLDDDNIADAVTLAHIGMALMGWWAPTVKYQWEALAGIGWKGKPAMERPASIPEEKAEVRWPVIRQEA